jgi:hypothetical protein
MQNNASQDVHENSTDLPQAQVCNWTPREETGQRLPYPIERRLSAELGTDVSGVRVHADRDANAAATLLGANAFSRGDHIAFRAGAYQPNSPAGQNLLGHEVAHVVQQKATPLADNLVRTSASAPH